MPEKATTSAVEVQNVRKVFGAGEQAFVALDTVNIDIRQNEFFTLLGPSGCGKTTLLRLIAGFDYPTSGEILLEGRNIAGLPPFRRPVNTVFQSYALFPHMTVAQNIGFGLEMLGRPREETSARVAQMLKLVRMEHLAGRRTSQISGGQQQRVALARALAPQPKVLLLDEPLSALDYKLRKEMQVELKRLQLETGITFIFVTHDQEEALAMSDRIAVMSAGQILQVGTPREIYDRPAVRFVAEFIGESNFIEAETVVADGTRATFRLPSGRPVSATLPPDFRPEGKASLMIRPEHARIVAEGEGAQLGGIVENVVYLGTDTHVHLRLDNGAPFTVRRQNLRGVPDTVEQGQRVGLAFGDDAAQVMRD